MNIETREIRDVNELSEQERTSDKWIPLRRKYAKQYANKQPVSDADYERIVAANARRLRRAAKRTNVPRSPESR